jgi:hypothetical protein
MCVFEFDGAPCVVSVPENELSAGTSIYPNPSSNEVTIRNSEYPIERVRIVDITGRTVSETNVNANVHRIEKGNLKDGIYLVQVVFDNGHITKKVVFN